MRIKAIATRFNLNKREQELVRVLLADSVIQSNNRQWDYVNKTTILENVTLYRHGALENTINCEKTSWKKYHGEVSQICFENILQIVLIKEMSCSVCRFFILLSPLAPFFLSSVPMPFYSPSPKRKDHEKLFWFSWKSFCNN